MPRTLLIVSAVLAFGAAAHAQTKSPSATQDVTSPAAPALKMIRITGRWIEGPGAIVTYGKPYQECAERCLANAQCQVIEYYLPKKKCNQYHENKLLLDGGSSIIGAKRPRT